MAALGWEPLAFEVRGQLIPTKSRGNGASSKLCCTEDALGG